MAEEAGGEAVAEVTRGKLDPGLKATPRFSFKDFIKLMMKEKKTYFQKLETLIFFCPSELAPLRRGGGRFDTDDGGILWETNTRKSFGIRNGIEAKGGSIESDGPVIVNGQVFITSGYEKWGEAPGNVVLVYSLNGE